MGLIEILEVQTGREVKREEVALAAGASLATYGRRKQKRWTVDELIRIAEHFKLSPTHLLIDMEVLDAADVRKAAEATGLAEATDLDLLNELVHRAMARSIE